MTWPEAFALVGGVWAGAWALRSLFRMLINERP